MTAEQFVQYVANSQLELSQEKARKQNEHFITLARTLVKYDRKESRVLDDNF